MKYARIFEFLKIFNQEMAYLKCFNRQNVIKKETLPATSPFVTYHMSHVTRHTSLVTTLLSLLPFLNLVSNRS